MARTISAALAAVAPPACFGCSASACGAGPLCAGCRGGLAWLSDRTVSLEGVDGVSLEAWAPLAYRGGARALPRALKFQGALAVADVMAAQIVAGAPPGLLDRGALVPVPLHPARRRKRGFNQAERLARASAAEPASRSPTALRGRARAAPRWAATATSGSPP